MKLLELVKKCRSGQATERDWNALESAAYRADKESLELSFRKNPDTSGGQFTQQEIIDDLRSRLGYY